MIVYGNELEYKGNGRIGIVVATHPYGEVAHIVYTDHTSPLYLVPRSFFQVSPFEARTMSKNELIKRTTSPFSVGTNAEFDGDETNVVRWIFKSPATLSAMFESGNPYICVDGVMGPGESLWTRKFGFLDNVPGYDRSKLRGLPANVPLTVRLMLVLDYGNFEGKDELPLKGFNPSYRILFNDVCPSPADSSRDIVEQAPWNKRASGPDRSVEVPAPERIPEDVVYEPAPPVIPSSPPINDEVVAPPTPGVTSPSEPAISFHPIAVPPHDCQAREVICSIIQDERSHQLLMRTGFFERFLQVFDEERAKKGPLFGRDASYY